MRRNSKYLCHINVEEWHKMQIHVYVPFKKIARKGLTDYGLVTPYGNTEVGQHWLQAITWISVDLTFLK